MAGVQALTQELLSRTQFVQVEVDVPVEAAENPWLTKAGMFAERA